jgi:dienelactone hydrolase
MVHEHYVERLRRVMRARRERLAALTTKADAQRYVRTVRAAVRRCFAPFPKRTPLNARISGRDAHERYDLEKIVFESRPGFLVTGNLYLPRGAKGRAPCVLGLCGHSAEGKACDVYQSYAQGLVRKGFVVFVIDPISQGERRQFYPEDGGDRPPLCAAHNLMGNAMALVDDFFGTWRVWDAIRGLDYLLARSEVDRTRVGVTGNSGGGTLSTYVTALDPRPTMAAPSCHISSFLTDLENELPRDAEQNPPGLLAAGLDSVDLLIAYAPRPTIVLAQHDDFFDERAARCASEDLVRIHRLLGSRGTAAYFAGPRGHGYHIENREAMYRFFMKHGRIRLPAEEPEVRIAEPHELFATPGGETYPLGSRRVFEFTAETAARLAEARGTPTAARLRAAARKVLRMPSAKGTPHYRVLRGRRFAVETEPGVQAIVTMYQPSPYAHRPPQGTCTLFVGHTSSDEDARSIDAIESMTQEPGFVSVDPRGLGATMPQTCDGKEFFAPYDADYLYACTGELLGESYFGARVFDVLRTADFLLAHGADEVRLLGRGLGSLIAAFAALLHRSEPACRLMHYLPSYRLLVDTPISSWPRSVMPRGVLTHFDLDDVYRALEGRLALEQPWDGRMEPPAP